MTRKRYSELNRPARMRKVAASLLGSAASLRAHLRTHAGVSPTAYRRTFRVDESV